MDPATTDLSGEPNERENLSCLKAQSSKILPLTPQESSETEFSILKAMNQRKGIDKNKLAARNQLGATQPLNCWGDNRAGQ